MNSNVKLFISICIVLMVTITAFSQPDSLWSRRYNMTISNSMMYHDGDYVFTGYSVRNDTVFSIVTKMDAEGELIWENIWDDRFSFREIIETLDSGIAIIGRFQNEFMIKKFNIDGDLLYSWNYELEILPEFRGFLSDGEGGYVAAGFAWITQENRNDFILLKVSSDGELEWLRGYEERSDQECEGLAAMPDGGFMLVGHTRVANFGNEVNVIRTDEDGEIIWQNHYGTEMIDIPANESGHAIIATEDGNYVIVGETIAHDEQNGHFNVLMMEFNSDGEVIWMEVIDLDRKERGRSVEKTIDGGFLISGFSSVERSDIGNPLFLKTDNRGAVAWSYIQNAVSSGTNDFYHSNALVHEDRSFSLIVGAISQGGAFPSFVQKFGRDPHGVTDGNNVFLPSWTGLEGAYPNPFNGITTFVFTVGVPAAVEIDIFNGLGRRQAELVRRSYPVGQHRLSWDAGGLPSGDYFARMVSGGRVSTKKVSLVK